MMEVRGRDVLCADGRWPALRYSCSIIVVISHDVDPTVPDLYLTIVSHGVVTETCFGTDAGICRPGNVVPCGGSTWTEGGREGRVLSYRSTTLAVPIFKYSESRISFKRQLFSLASVVL